MDTEEEKYRLLIRQREHLIENIESNKKSFHSLIFAFMTLVTASFLFLVTQKSINFPILFFATQILAALVYFSMGILFAMNNDRDCIRAIDAYIERKYKIDVLFFQGELSYKLINKWGSSFSNLTFGAGAIIVISLVGAVILRWNEIAAIMSENVVFVVIVLAELVGICLNIVKNFIYKWKGKSATYDACYKFLNKPDADEGTTNEIKRQKEVHSL